MPLVLVGGDWGSSDGHRCSRRLTGNQRRSSLSGMGGKRNGSLHSMMRRASRLRKRVERWTKRS